MNPQEENYCETCCRSRQGGDDHTQCRCELEYDIYLDYLHGIPERDILDISGKVWKTEGPVGSETWSLEPIEEEKIQYTHLSKTQIMKGLFLQIGTKGGLPIEIMILIYNQMRHSLLTDQNYIRKHNSHYIYHTILCRHSEKTPSYSEKWMNYFKSRCPQERGLEWAIKWEGRHCAGWGGNWLNSKSEVTRAYLRIQIKIIGEEDYLHKIIGTNGSRYIDIRYGEAPTKQKILYLNTSDKDEVLEDYKNHIDSNIGPLRLCLDDYGDSRII